MEDKVKAANAARRAAIFGILSGVMIFAYGLWVSRSHITHIGHWLRLSEFEAQTLFVLVDFVALYGKILTHKRLSAKTRRFGFRVMLTGLGMSTLCNVGSGVLAGSAGAAVYGLILVVIIVIVEYGVSITKPKTTNTESRQRTPAAAPTTVKSSPRKCADGCTCGKHNRRTMTEDVTPTSPGLGPIGDYAGRKA